MTPPTHSTHPRPILKLLGIPIRVHSSLILLIIYLVFVTALQLPFIAQESGVNPTSLSFGPIIWSLFLSTALLTSVIVHELGHAITARSLGLEVRSITLMMLGGIASIEQMPEKPIAELKLAIAGPLVSLFIFGTGYGIEHLTSSPDLILFFHWLSRTNLVLALFNLLPAFPLDGGRVLRAIISMRKGTLRATQTAIRVSHVFAIILGILGILSFNIFLLLVAFFIYAGAQTEGQMMIAKTRLKKVLVGSLVHRILPISDTETVLEASLRMREHHEPVLPVLSSSHDPALITLDQIIRVPQNQRTQTLVSEVMETVSRFVEFQDSLGSVFESIASSPLGALPVRDDGEIIGIIRFSDLTIAAGLSSLEESIESKPSRGKAA